MSAIKQKLAELSARFAAQAPQHRADLAAALASDDRAALRHLAHKLAGNAGMFGHPAISEAASDLEIACEVGGDYAEPARTLDALLAAL